MNKQLQNSMIFLSSLFPLFLLGSILLNYNSNILLDISKIEKLYKWKPKYTLHNALKEILNLCKKNLIHSAANITGGGIIENVIRSIPDNLTANIDLSKIKVQKIFSWLKSKNISDKEMLRTFNCGVGFCLITKRSNCKKIKRYFSNNFAPYEIGFISQDKTQLSLSKSIKW